MSPRIQYKEALQKNQWENFFVSILYELLFLYSLNISVKVITILHVLSHFHADYDLG